MARIKAHAADPKPAEAPAQAADVKGEAFTGAHEHHNLDGDRSQLQGPEHPVSAAAACV